MRTIFCYVSVFTLLLACVKSHAIMIIDDFSTTQVQAAGSSGTADGPGIIGGERFVECSIPAVDINSAVPGQLKIFNSSPPNGGRVGFNYDGGLAFPGGWLIGGLGHVDFTQGGINNAFLVNITSANSLGGTITIQAENFNFAGSAITVPLPNSPGILEIPFADFGIGPLSTHLVDFTDVGDMQVIFDLNPGESFTIDSITVDSTTVGSVPESTPTGSLLLVSGSAMIFLGKRYGFRSFHHQESSIPDGRG